MIEEIEKLTHLFFLEKCKTQKQKEIYEFSKQIEILKGLITCRLEPDKYEEYFCDKNYRSRISAFGGFRDDKRKAFGGFRDDASSVIPAGAAKRRRAGISNKHQGQGSTFDICKINGVSENVECRALTLIVEKCLSFLKQR